MRRARGPITAVDLYRGLRVSKYSPAKPCAVKYMNYQNMEDELERFFPFDRLRRENFIMRPWSKFCSGKCRSNSFQGCARSK